MLIDEAEDFSLMALSRDQSAKLRQVLFGVLSTATGPLTVAEIIDELEVGGHSHLLPPFAPGQSAHVVVKNTLEDLNARQLEAVEIVPRPETVKRFLI